MSEILVRPITPSDYPAAISCIQNTHRICYRPLYPQELIEALCTKYEIEKFTEKARVVSYFVAVEKETNTPRGIIGLQENRVKTFYVDPEYQGRGIGRKLYDYLETEAKKRGIKELEVEASPLGEPVYAKFGFTKVHTIEKERVGIHYTDAKMVKKIE